MKVGRGRSAGHTDQSDEVASLDLLSDFDQRTRKMTVPRGQAITVIDDNQIAVCSFPFGVQDDTISRGVYRSIKKGRDIQTEVQLLVAAERIGAVAVMTGNCALYRPNIWSESKT